MEKSKSLDLFFAILWSCFFFLYVLLAFFGISNRKSLSVNGNQTAGSCFFSDKSAFKSIRNSITKLDLLSRINKFTEDFYENSITIEPLYGEELYRFYISQICEQYLPDVDPYITLAVLETESQYRVDLVSSAGAVGLMQWIPKYHAWRMEKYNLNDMWDPYTNIIVGMDLLNDFYQSSGSWSNALYEYNHSTDYVNLILSKADLLREGECFG